MRSSVFLSAAAGALALTLSLSMPAPAAAQDMPDVKSVAKVLKEKARAAIEKNLRGGEAQASPYREQLTNAANAPSRAEDKARDVYRHPVETVEFFSISPDMKVGEYAPGGGW